MALFSAVHMQQCAHEMASAMPGILTVFHALSCAATPMSCRTDAGSARGRANVAELEWGGTGYMAQVTTLAREPVDLLVATDCTYIDPDGNTPDDNHFMIACAGLCHAKTRCLVTFEDRGTTLRDNFLAAAQTKFRHVQQVNRKTLPRCYQLEHIDLWEMQL